MVYGLVPGILKSQFKIEREEHGGTSGREAGQADMLELSRSVKLHSLYLKTLIDEGLKVIVISEHWLLPYEVQKLEIFIQT